MMMEDRLAVGGRRLETGDGAGGFLRLPLVCLKISSESFGN
jgi:hypothetical protein